MALLIVTVPFNKTEVQASDGLINSKTITETEALEEVLEDYALAFEGGGVYAGDDADYAEAPNSNVHSGFDQFTVEAWFKGYGTIVGNESAFPGIGPYSNSRGWTLRTENEVFAEEAIEFIWYFPTRNDSDILRVENVITDPDLWYHVAVTFDEGDVTIFLDGQKIAHKPDGIASVMETDHPITFGARPNWDEDPYPREFNYALTGQLTEIRTWSVPKSEQQIQEYKDVRITGTEINLTSYYPMNEGSGNVLSEKIRGNEALITGAAWVDLTGLTLPQKVLVPPAMVMLSEPSDNAFNIESGPVFSWHPTDRAEFYELQVAIDSSFSNLYEIGNIQQSDYHLEKGMLDPETVYYWRVRAGNNSGKSDWSEVWSFRTGSSSGEIAEIPELVYPENQTEGLALSQYLMWNPVENADNYELQVAEDEDFNQIVFPAGLASLEKKADGSTTGIIQSGEKPVQAMYVEGLDYHKTYYWRVRGINPDSEGDWSQVYGFLTVRDPAQSTALSAPQNNSKDIAIPVELLWEKFDEADDYELEISQFPDFDSAFRISAFKKESYQITELKDTTTYYWRVRATVDQQKTAWSQVGMFTTELRVPEIPQWTPNNHQENVETTPRLAWSTSERAEKYDLQIADDSDFSNIRLELEDHMNTEFQISDALAEGVTYYWRVRAENDSGQSGWSEALSFTTHTTTSASDDLPIAFELKQNYPNPFNPTTQIRFSIPEQVHVNLEVYDLLGRRVATLVNELKTPGWYDITFDATSLTSGMYIYRLQTENHIEAKQMMLVK